MPAEKIINDINAYLQTSLHSGDHNPGLYSGMSGLLLYNRYHSLYTGGGEFLNDADLDVLASKAIDTSLPQYSFANGLSGSLWTYFNLYKNNIIDLDADELSEYKEYAHAHLLRYAHEKNWDNIHGAFGVLFFLADSGLLDIERANAFLALIKDQFYEGNSFVYFRTQANIESEKRTFNLGMAHGIAGHIVILTKVLQLFPACTELKDLLKDMVTYLLMYKAKVPSKSYFPHLIDAEAEPDYTVTRIAWCYGDLGAGLALYRYARQAGDEMLEQNALDILIHSANKRSTEQCMVFDAPVCHGTAGAMHIFNRLYFETKIPDFKEASDYWYGKTIDLYNTRGMEGFGAKQYVGTAEYKLSPYLLGGVSGIGLALLAKMYPEIEPAWDGCLLLS